MSPADALSTPSVPDTVSHPALLAAQELITLGTSSSSRRRPGNRPLLPSRTTSLSNGRVIPLRSTSMTSSYEVPSTPSTASLCQHNSANYDCIIKNLIVDRSENDPSGARTSAAPSSKHVVRVSPRSRTLGSDPRRLLDSRYQSSMPSSEPRGSDAHDMVIYLRSQHLNRFIELPRPFPDRPLRVSLAEVGSPSGRPVLLFLGLGCVRYLAALFDDLAKAVGLRLICIDRWGMGKTGNVSAECRSLTGWAEVVEKVLDKIEVKSFQIIAHSAGAPYACATALRLGNKVTGKLHLLAPWVGADIDSGE